MEINVRRCMGFDIRIFNKKNTIISADPNILPHPPRIESLLEGNVWSISTPQRLFMSEKILNDFIPEGENKECLYLKICLTCSISDFNNLVSIYSDDWTKELPLEEELILNKWVLHGFDVIDYQGLYSGITGFGDNELANSIKDDLNESYLFSSPKDAGEFSKKMEKYAPTHAPFIVVGVLIKN